MLIGNIIEGKVFKVFGKRKNEKRQFNA